MSIIVRGFGRPVPENKVERGSLFLLAQGERLWVALRGVDRPILLSRLRGDDVAGTEFPRFYGGTGQYITLEGLIIVQPCGFPVPALEARSGSLAIDLNGYEYIRVLHGGDAYIRLGTGEESRSLGSDAIYYPEWQVVQAFGEPGLGGQERVIARFRAAE